LVWLDDDFDPDSRVFAQRDGPITEPVRVDPHVGIAQAELAAVRAFAG
jgi:hypothetical protein